MQWLNTGTKGLVKATPNDLIPDEIAIKTSLTNHQLLPTPKYEHFSAFTSFPNRPRF